MDNLNESLNTIAWSVLFGEELDVIDPNKPENQPRLNVEQKRHVENLKKFYKGPGKAYLDEMQREMRSKILFLVTGKTECNCTMSNEIKEINFMFRQLTKAAFIGEQK